LIVSRETRAAELFGDRADKALRFADLLGTVGIERGLIGPSEAERIWDRHIENCYPISTLCESSPDKKTTLADIGSGAGLPGIVIALARPDLTITLIEPLKRRVEFLTEVADELDLGLEVIQAKAEGVKRGFHHVTARAVAPLERLIESTWHLIKPHGSLLAMKGERAQQEIEDLSAKILKKSLSVELKEIPFAGQLSRIVIVHRLK
jgi:16S rRNA (guanine527-N7)-methyltransferase